MVAGDGKPVKIHLGGENELEDCRRQVTVYPLILSFSLFLLLDHHKIAKHSEMASKHNPTQVAEAAGLKHVALPEFESADGRLVPRSNMVTWLGSFSHLLNMVGFLCLICQTWEEDSRCK